MKNFLKLADFIDLSDCQQGTGGKVESLPEKSLFAKGGAVDRLAASMMGLPQPELPIRNYFADGMYAREISIPKGVVVIGAVHRLQNMVIVSKGCLEIVTDTGTVIVRAGDPPITCRPGRANAVLALEDSRWTNFFPNPSNETDIDKLCEMLTFARASELLGGSDNAQILAYAKLQQGELA